MKHAVKLMQETDSSYVVGGYGVVFGGRDLRGEWFDKSTDLWFDRLTETPMVMYQHGMDAGTEKSVLGKVVTKSIDDVGVWIEAQIDAANEYASVVRELVKTGVLGWSSGAVAHLVDIARDGKILSWPVAEFSLTPNPCEPRTVGVSELATLSVPAAAIKALPATSTPVDGYEGMSAPLGSYEALTYLLSKAVSRLLTEPGEYDSWCYIVATFPGYVVACVCEGMEEMTYHEIEYKLDRAGLPTLGKSRQVERRYVPVEAPPAEMAATAVMSAHTVRSATALAARVRVLHEGRVKEGRVLSPTNRKRLQEAHSELTGLVKAYADLLTDTEPKTSAEVGTTDADVEVQAAFARILALASGVEIPT